MKILVSSCLLGCKCRYDGNDNRIEAIIDLEKKYELIPVCPEELGGLPTPRVPAEIVDGQVLTRDGEDVTIEFQRGAQLALEAALSAGCEMAILKERSPSCGSGLIYDGTFSKVLVPGDGVTAKRLKNAGIRVFGESQAGDLSNIGK